MEDNSMQTTIVKWGNSQGIRIPKAFLQSIKITENDLLDVILEKEKIIIKKNNAKEHKTTKERLLEFYGVDYDKKHTFQTEIDWGSPAGKEKW
jgi:antitoxin MazE